MPAYSYTGDDARHYPALGLDARPADDDGPATTAEFEPRPPAPAEGEDPIELTEGVRYVPDDGRWEPVGAPAPPKAAKKTASSPQPPAPQAQAADTTKES